MKFQKAKTGQAKPDRGLAPVKFDKPTSGHEYLSQSKHFGGSRTPARADGPQDGLAKVAAGMKFIGG